MCEWPVPKTKIRPPDRITSAIFSATFASSGFCVSMTRLCNSAIAWKYASIPLSVMLSFELTHEHHASHRWRLGLAGAEMGPQDRVELRRLRVRGVDLGKIELHRRLRAGAFLRVLRRQVDRHGNRLVR